MSASEIELLGNNTVAVLDLTTFQWQSVPVDVTSLPPGFSGRGLNLIGHSIVPSPLNKDEIYIFGGRRNDEKVANMGRRNEHIPANLLSLNLANMKLCLVPVANPPGDVANIPEARLNQTCQMILKERVQLSEDKNEEKSAPRKGKTNRRPPFIPVKKPPLVPHPMVRIYGGSKLYEPGFCSGHMYDLYFVPLEKRDLMSRMESSSATRQNEDNMSVQSSLDNISSARPMIRKQSTMEIAIAAQNESGCGEVFHMLNLKDDSTVRLLSPTRGVDGQYFTLKTSLSRSRSTFTRPGTARTSVLQLPEVSASNRRPASAPAMNSLSMTSVLESSSAMEGTGDQDTLNGGSSLVSNGTALTKKSKAKLERERIKQMSSVLSPVIKGLTVHDARDMFKQLYPLPASRSTHSHTRSFSPPM